MSYDAYPLQWPIGRRRTLEVNRKGDIFHVPSGKVRSDLYHEMRLMNTPFTISSNVAIRNDGLPYANQRTPDDPGVALYFTRKGQELCIACDQYRTVDANLRAISNTIKAIRGMERWGTEDMVDAAFTGFKALPETIIMGEHTARAWWEVLQVSQNADWDVIEAAYKRLLHKAHPDKGGSDFAFQELQNAFKQAKEAKH